MYESSLSESGLCGLEKELNLKLACDLNCRNCLTVNIMNKAKSHYEIPQHVLIDMSDFTNSKFSLKTVPLEMKILQKNFVVARLASFKSNHHVAYVFFNGQWFLIDDDKNTPEVVKNININLQPHLLMYVQNNTLSE